MAKVQFKLSVADPLFKLAVLLLCHTLKTYSKRQVLPSRILWQYTGVLISP